MDTLFFGESEKAYFKTEEMQEVKTITFPIYPKEIHHLIGNKKITNVKKLENEIRILSCDIALLGGDANDTSVFTLISAKKSKKGTKYTRDVMNIESHNGMPPKHQALRIRRLFDDYDCDYIVLDRQGNGMSVYAHICSSLYDDERNTTYIPFYSMNEKDDPKFASYHTEDEYEEKIYTISATEEFNSNMAIDLKEKIINKNINFLLSRNDVREHFNEEAWYNKLRAETQAELMTPYMQTQILESEMVLLERVPSERFVKLKEQSGKRKDRYTSLAYGNYFITLQEREANSKRNKWDDEDRQYVLT